MNLRKDHYRVAPLGGGFSLVHCNHLVGKPFGGMDGGARKASADGVRGREVRVSPPAPWGSLHASALLLPT